MTVALLIIAGLVEFALRVALLLVLLLSVVGMLFFEVDVCALLAPICWEIVRKQVKA